MSAFLWVTAVFWIGPPSQEFVDFSVHWLPQSKRKAKSCHYDVVRHCNLAGVGSK